MMINGWDMVRINRRGSAKGLNASFCFEFGQWEWFFCRLFSYFIFIFKQTSFCKKRGLSPKNPITASTLFPQPPPMHSEWAPKILQSMSGEMYAGYIRVSHVRVDGGARVSLPARCEDIFRWHDMLSEECSHLSRHANSGIFAATWLTTQLTQPPKRWIYIHRENKRDMYSFFYFVVECMWRKQGGHNYK